MVSKQLDADEICPVCKSSRYLNPKMRFMIEPSCYHKMCESCVDRIFSQGPAPCPVAGCGRTLRKARFKNPRFEDLAIEREVDIRATVAKTLNLRESDFNTLRDYNDYAEEKETMVWNLVKGIDVPATQAKLKAHAAQNKERINRNAALDRADLVAVEDAEKRRRERSELAREASIAEREEERKDREAGRRQVIDRIAHSQLGDAELIAREGERVVLKQSSVRRAAREEQVRADMERTSLSEGVGLRASAGEGEAGSGFRGLRAPEVREVERAYDPFGGLGFRTKWYELQDSYEHAWSDKARLDLMFTAGGYDVGEYYMRAQLDAHAGLGVFLAGEMAKESAMEA
ncbi:MAG: TFIIH/NER complex subunit [Stictis urceolatum]|nr:TFIIH/NER complex subunit [Stictis urceolata]